jgi:hypothetical protein
MIPDQLRQSLQELLQYYFTEANEDGGTDWDKLNDLMIQLNNDWTKFTEVL